SRGRFGTGDADGVPQRPPVRGRHRRSGRPGLDDGFPREAAPAEVMPRQCRHLRVRPRVARRAPWAAAPRSRVRPDPAARRAGARAADRRLLPRHRDGRRVSPRARRVAGGDAVIITQTPLRIGLLGGGTDLPDYYRKNGGRVLNLALDKYVYVIVKQ